MAVSDFYMLERAVEQQVMAVDIIEKVIFQEEILIESGGAAEIENLDILRKYVEEQKAVASILKHVVDRYAVRFKMQKESKKKQVKAAVKAPPKAAEPEQKLEESISLF